MDTSPQQPPELSQGPSLTSILLWCGAVLSTLLVFAGIVVLGAFFYNSVALLGACLVMTYILLGPVNLVEHLLRWTYRRVGSVSPVQRMLDYSPSLSPRIIAIVIVYLAFFGLMIVSAVTLVPALGHQIQDFGKALPKYIRQGEEYVVEWSEDLLGSENLRTWFHSDLSNAASTEPEEASSPSSEASEFSQSVKQTVEPVTRTLGLNKRLPNISPVPYLEKGPLSVKEDALTFTPPFLPQLKPYLPSQKVLKNVGTITDEEKHLIGDSVLKRAFKPFTSFMANQASATLSNISTVLTSTVNGLLYLLLATLIIFYFLRDGSAVCQSLVTILPRDIQKPAHFLTASTHSVMLAFIKGQVLLGILTGFYMFIVYTIFGVPYAIFLGSFFAVSEILPVIGTWIGITPGIIVMLFSDDPWVVVPVWICSYLFQTVKDNILAPKIVGDVMGLHPLAVILALLICAKLAGLVGILLALPIVSILNVMTRYLIHGDKAHVHVVPSQAKRTASQTSNTTGEEPA